VGQGEVGGFIQRVQTGWVHLKGCKQHGLGCEVLDWSWVSRLSNFFRTWSWEKLYRLWRLWVGIFQDRFDFRHRVTVNSYLFSKIFSMLLPDEIECCIKKLFGIQVFFSRSFSHSSTLKHTSLSVMSGC